MLYGGARFELTSTLTILKMRSDGSLDNMVCSSSESTLDSGLSSTVTNRVNMHISDRMPQVRPNVEGKRISAAVVRSSWSVRIKIWDSGHCCTVVRYDFERSVQAWRVERSPAHCSKI